MIITVFKDFNETKTPHYLHIDKVLERIKNCKIQDKINNLRNEKDEKKKSELKKKLPCICFSGKLTTRKDSDLTEHSGFIVLDFDKLDNAIEFRNSLKRFSFIYSAFISPSGNGVKAIAKIPPIIEKHRGYYRGILKVFPELDKTSINESRICFESIDSEIYINTNATEFTDYVSEDKVKKENKKVKTDYSKVNVALNMIRNAIDGSKHETLLKASKLMGGYIQSGYVDEFDAVRLLEIEIASMPIDDLNQAKKTIEDGINYGKKEPITEEIKQFSRVKESIDVNNLNKYLSKESEIEDYINQWRTGTFKKGQSTGLKSLDNYFLFKEGYYNVFNGFDNVGKSTTLWYFLTLSMLYLDWRWVVYSGENRNGSVFKRFIEFYWGEKIDKISEIKYKKAYDFIKERLVIINNEQLYNFKDVLKIVKSIKDVKQINGVLIDPYNALKIDLSDSSKLSTHEYHYEAASEMQMFAKKENICVYLNCHVVTSAMRNGVAPNKADTEGGGKFANKADDFVTIHRETQDPQLWMQTQLHIRKVKEIETGGGYTPKDSPYILTMNINACGFSDLTGIDPVKQWHDRNGTNYESFTLQQNNDFLKQKDIVINNEDEPF